MTERLKLRDHLALRRRNEFAFGNSPACGYRLITIGCHAQLSLVTRITSSMVVMPASALSVPSAYIVRMPLATAA
jgi:hypothetical protein